MINEMLVWKDKLVTKRLSLNLHMSENMLVRHSKEHLLERKETFACVNNAPKKLTIGGKIKLLNFQRVGHESKHPRVHMVQTSYNVI
jgi:hypothetical protein